MRGSLRLLRAWTPLAAAACAALAASGCGEPPKSTILDPHLRSLFTQGNYYLRHGKHEAARSKFEEILISDPDLTGVRLNAGDACYLAGDYQAAAQHYGILYAQRPDEWGVLSRQIQAYEAAGERDKADRAVADLYAARKSWKNRKLRSVMYFVRERGKVGEVPMEIVEFMDREGSTYPLWEVHCRDKAGKVERILHVDHTAAKKSRGTETKAETVLYEGSRGKGCTYSQWEGLPLYRVVREQVMKVLSEPPCDPKKDGEKAAGTPDAGERPPADARPEPREPAREKDAPDGTEGREGKAVTD